MNEDIWIERASHDFVAAMFSAFAMLAIGLAALGIYGVVSHSVAERNARLASASRWARRRVTSCTPILREGNVMALSGVALGLLLTKYSVGWLQRVFAARTISTMRHCSRRWPSTLFVVAVLSALIPALRATRIDPVESLRSE